MNLHEYQGKEILAQHGVNIQRGLVLDNLNEIENVSMKLTKETGTDWFVVKAQIHAGGRGKGGGVKLAKSKSELKDVVSSILGMNLITPQTSKEGKLVRKVLIAEDVYYPGESETEEFYVSILLNRKTGKNMIMYSTEGGMDIESVAEKTPELIFYEDIDPLLGILPFQARKIAFNLGLSGKSFKEMVKFISLLYKSYVSSDSSLFEINPVLKTSDNKIMAVDAKVTLDDNALFRHKDYSEWRDLKEENPVEVEARELGLNYVDLDGNVGCMVNGAGLAMATMDLIKQSGGDPANFLDVGGTADAKRVESAFRLILKDPNVKAILVNIFGGIVRCDRVAQGIVDAYNNLEDINVPIIVRLQGTNAKIAKEIIDSCDFKVYSATEFQEAADKIQEVLA
ncbi:ADP-forming succinate--CoA ligase subunit beta [Flavobacteriaceae bacterium]|jgi:succinyl-CoA synthetase beta subunit|nr:ADP-forming succinate--CoA ligase subunit beta [Flavobacteriaceae bacterium]MBT5232584.1 ADP-forming succinate--CoA ligase subunit beta [Flavobacteriaceae bacterium]MBT6653956.1 ADP-forming succinate--CoA ligase subunit beta [Flavobacteriaceae bacterium]MDA7567386.1 ADP-forming succinate--CoA ligase subunit beta [Flavobacteriaceae bacterium]MDA8641438.1 ADP-forming succinate--CoA ligase subunit beta [Flavobacteriaceae bacterium]|tara:strand:+ start:546 stop:1736 length:1191 start_codon:yes stop_codon:yes gene_type:complete